MDRGYIKLWRRCIDTGMLKNHELWVFWCWCLMKATHKPIKQMVGFQEVFLNPGQFIFGRKSASSQTGVSEQSIRTCLKNLQNMKNLTIKSTNKFSIITIVNWDTYQYEEEKSTSKLTNDQPTTNQQLTTNKNINTKEKNIYSDDFLTFWKAYPKKAAKAEAWKAWRKLNGTRPDINSLLSAIQNQKQSDQWQRNNGQYIPNPASWLNRGHWEDEVQVNALSCQQTGSINSGLYKEIVIE